MEQTALPAEDLSGRETHCYNPRYPKYRGQIKELWIRRNREGGKRFYIPRDSDYCYTLIPIGWHQENEASRTFPGGGVSSLAEYWLRSYEILEKNLASFEHPVVIVRHRDFITDPHGTLQRIFTGADLPSVTYDLPVKLDLSRNERWRTVLNPCEQDELETFVERNRLRIERLKYADTTL